MERINRYQVLAFMLLILLATAVLRLPNLPTIPPGLHYDEAANVVLTAEISRGESRPIFITSYTGKEVLFFYLAGLLMRLVGESVFTLRLTAVIFGTLTVAAAYWLGRELLRDRRVALLAAALLAVSFWHVLFSHQGFRAVSQPLLQALMIAALFRGLRTHQWRWLVFSGVCLGLAGYTYLAVRLFPALLLLTAVPLLFQRRGAARRWRQLLLVGGVGLLVFTPLLAFFIANPETFWVRIGQVGPASGLTVWESYWRSLQMFFWRGDPYLRFNLVERPLFSFFWGAMFLAGWGLCLLALWRRRTDRERAAAVLLLSAPFIMILPTALAINEIVPSNLRAIGLIPFIFYLPALGFVALLDDLAARGRRPQLATTGFLVLLGAVLFGGVYATGQAYYRDWATDPALFLETDGDLTAVAPFLDALPPGDEALYVAALHHQHPTLAALSQRYGEVKWLPGSAAFVIPPDGAALYVYPANSPLPDWAAPFLADAEQLPATNGPDGAPAFSAYRTTAVPPINPATPAFVNLGNAVTLLGYDVGIAPAGETLPLTLYWRIENRPPGDFTPFVHLEDPWRTRWSQAQTFAYPASQWEPGEVVAQRVDVPVPPGAPPGSYLLRLGWFDQASGERLPVLDADGRFAGDSFLIPEATVLAGTPPDPLPQPPFVVDETAVPGLRLLGFERGGREISTGERLNLAFWWLAEQPQPNLTLRLELYRPDNIGKVLWSGRPVHDSYPFANWPTPQFVIDRQGPRIPESLESGEYRLLLRLLGADGASLYETELGPLTVTQTERLFSPPLTQFPQDATFGDEIRLPGYDLEPGEARGTYTLRLVWQAVNPPSADYTVFVHVLNPDGTCCLWQQDIAPQQGRYPTSRWLPGEIVVDEYQIALPPETPPGAYVVEIGLYLPENGRRLQMVSPLLPPSDHLYLHPLQVE